MDPDLIVTEFINFEGIVDLCDRAILIRNAMQGICPEFCSDIYVWACMMYAGISYASWRGRNRL